jgi:hypothetical protein
MLTYPFTDILPVVDINSRADAGESTMIEQYILDIFIFCGNALLLWFANDGGNATPRRGRFAELASIKPRLLLLLLLLLLYWIYSYPILYSYSY